MPYTSRTENGKEIKIYYETHGEGEPIIFHHGNGNRSSDWSHLGYVDALAKDFKLIFIDLRGYGNSSRPHDLESYSLKSRVEDTISVMDQEGIEQAHCLGGSFSTSFCFLFARYYPERFKSYIFLTPGLLFDQLTDEDLKAAMLEGAKTYLEKLESLFGKFEKPFLRETFLANDGKALWASNSAEWFDYKDYIQYIDKPSLIYTGSEEPINEELFELSQQLPNCQYEVMPGLAHAETYWRGDLAGQKIKAFVKSL